MRVMQLLPLIYWELIEEWRMQIGNTIQVEYVLE